jgi:tryptophan-rich sensory protein
MMKLPMNTQQWYETLNKPFWAPHQSVFGQVWSILYVIIFAVNIYVLVRFFQGDLDWKIGLPFWINLALNFVFTPVQFGLRNNFLAMLVIYGVLATIVWSMIAIWPQAKFISISYLPYLVWVAIATVLQTSIWWLNRSLLVRPAYTF